MRNLWRTDPEENDLTEDNESFFLRAQTGLTLDQATDGKLVFGGWDHNLFGTTQHVLTPGDLRSLFEVLEELVQWKDPE